MGWRKDQHTRPFFIGYGPDGQPQYYQGNYIGGDVSSITQAEVANQYNWNAMKDQQAFNAQQQELANAFNERMYDKNNAYNSPQAQMARFAAAGLNPFMLMGSGNTNTAQAVTGSSPASSGMASAATSNTSNAAQMIQAENSEKQTALQAVSSITSQIADTVDKLGLTPRSAAEIGLLTSQSKSQNSSANLSDTQSFLNKYNLGFLNETHNVRKEGLSIINRLQGAQGDLASESVRLTKAQSVAQELTNLQLPQQLSANIGETLSRTTLNNQNVKLLGYKLITEKLTWNQIEAETAKSVQDAVESAARVEGIRINNKILRTTERYTNERLIADLESTYQNTDYLRACTALQKAEVANAKTPQNTANWLTKKIENAKSDSERNVYNAALELWMLDRAQTEFVGEKAGIIGNVLNGVKPAPSRTIYNNTTHYGNPTYNRK